MAEQLGSCISDLFDTEPLPVGADVLLLARSLQTKYLALTSKVAPGDASNIQETAKAI